MLDCRSVPADERALEKTWSTWHWSWKGVRVLDTGRCVHCNETAVYRYADSCHACLWGKVNHLPYNHTQYDNMPHNNYDLFDCLMIYLTEHMLLWMTDTVMKTSKLTLVRVCVKLMIQKDPSAVWQISVLSAETGWQLHFHKKQLQKIQNLRYTQY